MRATVLVLLTLLDSAIAEAGPILQVILPSLKDANQRQIFTSNQPNPPATPQAQFSLGKTGQFARWTIDGVTIDDIGREWIVTEETAADQGLDWGLLTHWLNQHFNFGSEMFMSWGFPPGRSKFVQSFVGSSQRAIPQWLDFKLVKSRINCDRGAW